MAGVLVALLAMALVATIRLSVPGFDRTFRGPVVRLLTHPAWLLPLIVCTPSAVGLFIEGRLSPWPPAAYLGFASAGGATVGVAALLAVLITDLWLLWTPSRVLKKYVLTGQEHGLRHAWMLNMAMGAIVISVGLFH